MGRLGRVFHAHDLYRPALGCYEAAIQLEPGNFRWPYLAAHASAASDKLASVAYFDKVRALAPANDVVHIAHGNLLAQLGRREAATEAFRPPSPSTTGRASHASVWRDSCC